MKKSILFIGEPQGFVYQAIEKNLQETGFTVIRVDDELDEIEDHRFDAQMLLYYPSKEENIPIITDYLTDLCKDEKKTLCVVGDIANIEQAQKAKNANRIHSVYPRPLDIKKFVNEMRQLAGVHDEYKRMKTILIIDDDPDFLSIMNKWLKSIYKADCVRSGVEALLYLNNMRPDLILLDYGMPEMDGYQVMNAVRGNPLTCRIPIIFLTGKNDRDSVMRILKHRPDGYLLKSMKKEELLDTLERFFADTILGGDH